MMNTHNNVVFNDELMTVQECASFLKLTPDSIYGKVQRKELPFLKIGTGPKARVRFSKAAVLRALTNVQPVSSVTPQ